MGSTADGARFHAAVASATSFTMDSDDDTKCGGAGSSVRFVCTSTTEIHVSGTVLCAVLQHVMIGMKRRTSGRRTEARGAQRYGTMLPAVRSLVACVQACVRSQACGNASVGIM